MATVIVLCLASTAWAATYNYSASVSNTLQFEDSIVLCNTTFDAANATGLFYTQPAFSDKARYGVGLGLAQNTKRGSSGVGLQASLMFYPGVNNYFDDTTLGYDLCAFAFNIRGVTENTILLGHNDNGTCQSMLGNDCLSAFKDHTNTIAASVWNASANASGGVNTVCDSIMDKLGANIPAACTPYLDSTNTLIAGNVAISQEPATAAGLNGSALASSCAVANGFETWYNINTQLSGGYSDETYDVVTTVVWPIVGVFIPPVNRSINSIISYPETEFTCIRTDHYNAGSRVSPAVPSGTPYTTTAATTTPTASGISAGAIAGIVIAVIALLLIVASAVWFCRRRRNKRNMEEIEPEVVEIYTKEQTMDRKYSEVPGQSLSEMSPDTHKTELPVNFSAELQGDHHYELEGSHRLHELPADVPGEKLR